jgi:peptide/nickel transport system substrate-binding protein
VGVELHAPVHPDTRDVQVGAGKAGLEFVPDLATEVPKPTDGGKTWKFTLKDGMKYEDGTPITTKDIKYGIERVFAQDVINGGPTYVITWLDQGRTTRAPMPTRARRA